MSTELDEALEWFDRAEQAREVAGQLTDPGARNAVLAVAETFDRLGRAVVGRHRRGYEEDRKQLREQERTTSRSRCPSDWKSPQEPGT
jgi:hypothetical protein